MPVPIHFVDIVHISTTNYFIPCIKCIPYIKYEINYIYNKFGISQIYSILKFSCSGKVKYWQHPSHFQAIIMFRRYYTQFLCKRNFHFQCFSNFSGCVNVMIWSSNRPPMYDLFFTYSQTRPCFRFTVEWTGKTGIERETHAAYLKEFCDNFYCRISELVNR